MHGGGFAVRIVFRTCIVNDSVRSPVRDLSAL